MSDDEPIRIDSKPYGYCKRCHTGLRTMISMSNGMCAQCEAAVRDAEKPVAELIEHHENYTEPMKPLKMKTPQELAGAEFDPTQMGISLDEANKALAVMESPQSRHLREVGAQLELTPEMGQAMREASIAQLRSEGFMVLSPHELQSSDDPIGEALAQRQELVDQLRGQLHGMTTERDEQVKLGNAAQILIKVGDEDCKRLQAEIDKVTENYRKLVEAKKVLREEIAEDPYKRPDTQAGSKTWREYALELEAHLQTAGEHIQDLQTDLADADNKPGLVDHNHPLWDELFMHAMVKMPEPPTEAARRSPEVLVKSLVRASCRLADEMFAHVADYKRGEG